MKLKRFLITLYCAVVGFFSPEAITLIYVCLTGTAKGKGVSLGSEYSLYILFGLIALLIWLCLMTPIIISIFKAIKQKQKRNLILYLCAFFLMGTMKLIYVYFIF